MQAKILELWISLRAWSDALREVFRFLQCTVHQGEERKRSACWTRQNNVKSVKSMGARCRNISESDPEKIRAAGQGVQN